MTAHYIPTLLAIINILKGRLDDVNGVLAMELLVEAVEDHALTVESVERHAFVVTTWDQWRNDVVAFIGCYAGQSSILENPSDEFMRLNHGTPSASALTSNAGSATSRISRNSGRSASYSCLAISKARRWVAVGP